MKWTEKTAWNDYTLIEKVKFSFFGQLIEAVRIWLANR